MKFRLGEDAGRFSVNQAEIDQHLAGLAAISESPAPVVTRVLFSEADLAARQYVRGLCEECGLQTRTDPAGNIFARWQGLDPDLPAIGTGSHIDAIPNAGRFDGVVGVLGALGSIQALRRAGFKPRRSIDLIIFTAEEPTRFGLGCLGSRILSGALAPELAANLKDGDGRSFEEWRTGAQCHGELASARLPQGAYAAFIELHIEQGPILEQEGIALGVVEKIAAPCALRVRLEGEGGHAGAVLMPVRHDALLAGAEIALAVERAALDCGSPDAVGTTGVLRVFPGAINSVPARVDLEIDMRDTCLETREWARGQVEQAIAEVCARRGVQHEIETINVDPPAECEPALVELTLDAAKALGFSARRLISRAYHDTLFMARICPVTMLFIPCRGGWSHRPDEYASPEAIHAGASVLAQVLASLAQDV